MSNDTSNTSHFDMPLADPTRFLHLQAREAFVAPANTDELDVSQRATAMLDEVDDHEPIQAPCSGAETSDGLPLSR